MQGWVGGRQRHVILWRVKQSLGCQESTSVYYVILKADVEARLDENSENNSAVQLLIKQFAYISIFSLKDGLIFVFFYEK